MSKLTARAEFRRFRRKHHLTQARLARALDITVRAVKYIEAGERHPRWDTVEKFKALAEKYRKAAEFEKGRHIYG